MTIFIFYASRSRTPLLTLTLTVRFSAPLFFSPVKEQKSKEMLIIYFYIYIYININFLFHPFSLKGELRNFGLSVSVSADLLHDPEKKSSKKSGFSDFICNFALSIVGFFVSFCNTKIH